MAGWNLGAVAGAALAALLGTSTCDGASIDGRDPAECPWQHLPQAKRDGLIAAYARQGSDGLGTVQISDAIVRAIARSCKYNDPDATHLQALSAALAGAALRHGSELGLAARGAQWKRLDEVWRTAGAQRNALLAEVVNPDSSPKAARRLFELVEDLTRRAGGPSPAEGNPLSDPVFRLYADYFTGRAIEVQNTTSARR